MKGKLIRSIFWVMIAVFIIIVGIMFVAPARELLMPFGFFTALGALVLLGAALLYLTVKTVLAGKLKKFLLLTGASVVGLPVFGVLHNVVGGLLNVEEPVFFILATIVCPIGFLVGAIGTIVLAAKNKSNADQAIEGGKL